MLEQVFLKRIKSDLNFITRIFQIGRLHGLKKRICRKTICAIKKGIHDTLKSCNLHFDLPNVLLQPHHASGTIETRKAMGKLARDNLTAHFAGDPLLTPVN